MRLVWILATFGMVAPLAGCGTVLVFARYHENLKPENTGPGRACMGAKVDDLIKGGDAIRDELLKPLVAIAPSARLDGRSAVEMAVNRGRAEMQSELSRRYRMWKDAQVCYEGALAQDPSVAYAYLNLGVMAMRMADFVFVEADRGDYYSRAQNYLGRALEQNRLDGQTVYYMAELHVRRANFDVAEKLLRELIDKKWDRAHVHNLLGYIALRQGRKDLAEEEWKKATLIDTPAEATEWALTQTRPLKTIKYQDPKDEAQPAGYRLWNFDTLRLEDLTSGLPNQCGWASNGRPRCS
jgi:tetratricopeptide (TPR) repeat protein